MGRQRKKTCDVTGVTTSTKILGIGTTSKLYWQEGAGYNDITPLRETTAAGDVTFSASNGSSTITVSDTSNGVNLNDFVTFSGAASLGGNIIAAVLNQEYQVASVVNTNSYTMGVVIVTGKRNKIV